MPEYSVCYLDDLGHVDRRHNITASDHLAAIEIAQECRDGKTIEVWQGTRFLIRITRSVVVPFKASAPEIESFRKQLLAKREQIAKSKAALARPDAILMGRHSGSHLDRSGR